MRNALLASVASRFAHLAQLGRGRSKAKAEEDEDEKKDAKRAEEDEDDERMEDDRDDEKESRAEDDDKDDEEKSKSSKKGKSDGDDERCEDDDDDEKEAKAVRRGRRLERARVATVLGSKHITLANLPVAAAMLCESNASADAIVGALKATAGAVASADRRERNPRIEATAPERSDAKQVEASWDVAIKRVTGGR